MESSVEHVGGGCVQSQSSFRAISRWGFQTSHPARAVG
ncbi:hypothetical protein OEM_23730 [Mycobacterium intracellulare subsp. yongonense 05-1390]|nr:hypothetical protein OEM_23730 [Mycobacterium intracellulare subsp. yongonense 05-1390]ARR78037.1 hypothetical protein MOTT12_02373 [Mycobacterium intracellulare subsp. yongonense]